MLKSQIILFLIFICLNYSKSDSDIPIKCVDDSKIKQACAILTFDDDGYPVYEFIKKHKCKKNKKCLDLNGVTEYCAKTGKSYPSFRTCQDAIEPKNEGEKCNYGEECKSKICESNKCTVRGVGGECINNYSCEAKHYCKNSTCTKLLQINETCDDLTVDMCEGGAACNYNNDYFNESKCTVIGSLEEGERAQIPEFCLFGLSQDLNRTFNEQGTAANNINTTVPVCFNTSVNGTCSGSCQPANITNKDGKIYEFNSESCEVYGTDNECKFSETRSRLFKEYIKEFDKLDKSSILDNKNFRLTYDNMFHYDDSNVKELYYKFKNYSVLRSSDALDSDGNLKSSCEYNVLTKGNNCRYITLSIMFFILLTLLFD